jgi:hypothetical protein
MHTTALKSIKWYARLCWLTAEEDGKETDYPLVLIAIIRLYVFVIRPKKSGNKGHGALL